MIRDETENRGHIVHFPAYIIRPHVRFDFSPTILQRRKVCLGRPTDRRIYRTAFGMRRVTVTATEMAIEERHVPELLFCDNEEE